MDGKGSDESTENVAPIATNYSFLILSLSPVLSNLCLHFLSLYSPLPRMRISTLTKWEWMGCVEWCKQGVEEKRKHRLCDTVHVSSILILFLINISYSVALYSLFTLCFFVFPCKSWHTHWLELQMWPVKLRYQLGYKQKGRRKLSRWKGEVCEGYIQPFHW